MRDLHLMLRDVVAEVLDETSRSLAPISPASIPRPSASTALERRRERGEGERFLRQLDPDSQEGLWFEALAERYPSRLEAAIAYVREVKR